MNKYNKTNWEDRVVEFPNKIKLIDNGDGTYDKMPAHGEIIKEGTPLSALNMQKIEDAVYENREELLKLVQLEGQNLTLNADDITNLVETEVSSVVHVEILAPIQNASNGYKPVKDPQITLNRYSVFESTKKYMTELYGVDADRRDQLVDQGIPYVLRRVKKIVLDGSQLWRPSTKYTGYKAVAIDNFPLNEMIEGAGATNPKTAICIKNDGTPLTWGSSGTAPYYINLGNDNLYISLPNSETGWAEDHTPTEQEIKDFFAANPMILYATHLSAWREEVETLDNGLSPSGALITCPGYNNIELITNTSSSYNRVYTADINYEVNLKASYNRLVATVSELTEELNNLKKQINFYHS